MTQLDTSGLHVALSHNLASGGWNSRLGMSKVKKGLENFLEAYPKYEGRVQINPERLKSDGVALLPTPLSGIWTLSNSLTPNRFIVAESEFDSDRVPGARALKFYHKWQSRMMSEYAHEYAFDDYVLVLLNNGIDNPDQELGENTVAMIEDVQRMEPERPIVLRLPDGEKVDPMTNDYLRRFDYADRINFSRGNIDRLMASCAYAVTQNSPLALQALFHGKNVVQYQPSTYHHLSRKSFAEKRIQRCYNRAKLDRPAFDKYLYWAFAENGIDTEGDFGVLNVVQALENYFKRNH